MTQTDSEGNEIILEPGDPGYVDPNAPPAPAGAPADSGQDLRHVPERGETDAEFQVRTRNLVVDSQHPADIVPNTPQIRMTTEPPPVPPEPPVEPPVDPPVDPPEENGSQSA